MTQCHGLTGLAQVPALFRCRPESGFCCHGPFNNFVVTEIVDSEIRELYRSTVSLNEVPHEIVYGPLGERR